MSDMWYLCGYDESSELTVIIVSANPSFHRHTWLHQRYDMHHGKLVTLPGTNFTWNIKQRSGNLSPANIPLSFWYGRFTHCRTWKISWLVGWCLPFARKFLLILLWSNSYQMLLALDDKRTMADSNTGKPKWMNFDLGYPPHTDSQRVMLESKTKV